MYGHNRVSRLDGEFVPSGGGTGSHQSASGALSGGILHSISPQVPGNRVNPFMATAGEVG